MSLAAVEVVPRVVVVALQGVSQEVLEEKMVGPTAALTEESSR